MPAERVKMRHAREIFRLNSSNSMDYGAGGPSCVIKKLVKALLHMSAVRLGCVAVAESSVSITVGRASIRSFLSETNPGETDGEIESLEQYRLPSHFGTRAGLATPSVDIARQIVIA